MVHFDVDVEADDAVDKTERKPLADIRAAALAKSLKGELPPGIPDPGPDTAPTVALPAPAPQAPPPAVAVPDIVFDVDKELEDEAEREESRQRLQEFDDEERKRRRGYELKVYRTTGPCRFPEFRRHEVLEYVVVDMRTILTHEPEAAPEPPKLPSRRCPAATGAGPPQRHDLL